MSVWENELRGIFNPFHLHDKKSQAPGKKQLKEIHGPSFAQFIFWNEYQQGNDHNDPYGSFYNSFYLHEIHISENKHILATSLALTHLEKSILRRTDTLIYRINEFLQGNNGQHHHR
jgi:hypothetical protein